MSNQPETTSAKIVGKIPTYQYSNAEKLQFLLQGLKQKLRPAKNLIAPFAGEFGYELMQWHGFVRARKPSYEQVHIVTYPGRDYLYEGCTVHYHHITLKDAGYGYGIISPAKARALAHAKAVQIGLKNYDIFDTSLLCTQYHKQLLWRQEFRLFTEPPVAGGIRDIAFHFRAVQKEGPDKTRNYSPAHAAELVRQCREHGFSVLCIGHPDYSMCPPGVDDFRSVDLQQTISAISSARVVCGEISGPLHLANLCGKPTVFFADGQWRMSYCLRWNPFRVPLYIAADDTMQPEPSRVFKALADALSDLRQRTHDFTEAPYMLPAQQIANY